MKNGWISKIANSGASQFLSLHVLTIQEKMEVFAVSKSDTKTGDAKKMIKIAALLLLRLKTLVIRLNLTRSSICLQISEELRSH